MKLHIPKVLLYAVLSACCVFFAQAVEIPDNYKSVEVQSADSLTNYTTNSDTDHYAFLLGMDVEVPADISLSGGHLLFATKDGQASASMTFGGASSHAFSEVDTLTFNTLSNLSFSGITLIRRGYGGAMHDIYGGAIHVNDGGTLIISHVNDNQAGTTDVLFENNVVLGYDGYVFGAAIYAGEGSTVEISYNGDVSFSGNSATAPISSYESTSYTSSFGGAIYAGGNVSISNNGNVSFSANSASASSYFGTRSPGGAIHAEGMLSISNNGDVSFRGNSAVSSTPSSYHITCDPYGGAIYAWGAVTISNNVDVSFSGNSASTSDTGHAAYGGAIYACDTLTISNNADVSFSGNSASVDSFGDTYGGAILATKNLNIQGNDSVTFEQNYERVGSVYLLRSIYQDGGSGGSMNLSAKTGGHITFYDSVYGGATALNADYTDAEGNTQKAKGDIIFSGKYAKEHLDAILATNNEGRIATEGEILNSRTSNMGVTELYGGRLRIEDGAIYQGNGITVAEGANATLMLKDGTLSHAGYDITISTGSVLSAEGTNSLTASVLTIQDGGMMQLALGMAQVDGAAVLTTTGSLSMGNISFDLTGTEYLAAGEYKLLTRTEGVDYDISGWTLNGATSDQLRWENGTLYYTGGHDWNHGVTDDDDISDLGEILGNLIINGGDITLDDMVNAIQDAVDAGFGHGQGHIVINRGGIHISGAGDLDGHIIFNGDLKDIRKLFIEKDITNIKIELGGSSEAENIVDVGGEYTVEIDSLAGDGSMSKTGEGEMVVYGHGHKVGGMLDVQEGTLTFTAGNETAGEPTGTETEVNELVVGNKKDKEAKVKVEKDTKVKGNKMQVDGQHAVVTNNGTMDFSGEVKVKKGHLENNGSISKVTLEGGKVSGSGEFAGLEMLGGELVVGNSPGLQTYTDSATFTEGSIIFSMADTDTAATSGTAGWDSSAYSTIDMDGNALMLGENVNIVLELGGAALESLVAEVNATLEFSLKLIQNIDSASLTMGAEGFAMLLDNTRILITEDSEGLTAATLHLAGLDITGMLSNAVYRYEGSTLVFSGTITNNGTLTVPEPATATLSLLALAALAARRRRK